MLYLKSSFISKDTHRVGSGGECTASMPLSMEPEYANFRNIKANITKKPTEPWCLGFWLMFHYKDVIA